MRRSDWAWPAGILAIGTVEVTALSQGFETADARQISATSALGGILIETLACALLVFRRHWPLTVALTVSVLASLLPTLGIHMDEPATPILILGLAMFAAGRYRGDRWALLAPLAGAAAPTVAKWLDSPGQVDITDAFFILFILGAPFAFGRLVRRQSAAHEREQEQVRRQAIATERLHIARELHDVLAHSISGMVMAAHVGFDTASDVGTREAFDRIAVTGRGALAEVGNLLRLMRTSAEPDTPNPSSADIPALIDGFRSSGMDLQVTRMDLPASTLGPARELSVYRIVQEALTNARKYAPDGPTHLSIGQSGSGISIDVLSETTRESPLAGSGQGLIGMRERVEMFGGSFQAGPTGRGTFEVHGLIPWQADA